MFRNIILVVALFALPNFAQEKDSQKDKPRVFVTDSKSWEISGGFGAGADAGGGTISGGARPQTAEIIKTFGERCADCIVTIKQERADYVIILDHEGGKPFVRRDNKFAIFNKDGDAIKSGSTRSLGNSVKEACEAMMKDWRAQSKKGGSPEPAGSTAPGQPE
jgi:hypothetical protein